MLNQPAADVTLNDNRDLEAPLLEKSEIVEENQESSAEDVSSSSLVATKSRLNLLSFGTGTFIGLMSQIILASTMWDKTILEHPVRDLLLFSLVWSVLTCLIVNGAMALFVRDMKASFCCPQKQETEEKADEDSLEWEDVTCTMEGFLIGGALFSISAWWLTLDIGAVFLPMPPSIIVALVIASTILYIFFIALVLPTTNGVPAWWNCLLASILGLVIGFGSQSALSAVFWTGMLPRPAIASLVLFSFLWSSCTIAGTFLGCVTLRLLKHDNNSPVIAERAYLRMESFYVLSSLVGISFAWISLDLVLGLTHQIVPSLLMLILSLFMFRVILYCFPEDKCIEEFEKETSSAKPQP